MMWKHLCIHLFFYSFVGLQEGGDSNRRYSRWRLFFNAADIKGRGTTKAQIMKQEFVDTEPNVNIVDVIVFRKVIV